MSFLACMANYSKRKTTVPKEDEPSIRKVMQVIPAASCAPPKKKFRKRDKVIMTKANPPVQDSSKGKSKVIEVNEKSPTSPIEISLKEANTSDSNPSHLELVDKLRAQGTWLLFGGDGWIRFKVENIPLRKLVTSKPPHVIGQRCFTDIFVANNLFLSSFKLSSLHL
uniref:Uncharacterized protein n=1 Tax=Cannabis sativa TaxID=3483 RepID=A0A803QH47_CANSA